MSGQAGGPSTVEVSCSATAADGWQFLVHIREHGGQTEHEVHLARADYKRLAGQTLPPETLVHRTFEFLLARESKESILRRFDLSVVSRYFPEFEGEIRRMLPG